VARLLPKWANTIPNTKTPELASAGTCWRMLALGHQSQPVRLMAVSIENRIRGELDRLRKWREFARDEQCKIEDAIVHERINELLDAWQAERAACAAPGLGHA
jgi:hypothetical protein